MSLFENDLYQWRETYFVLFPEKSRPQAAAVAAALRRQDPHYEVTEVVADDDGLLESLTLRSPEDSSAMDITFVTGEEVTEQREELLNTLAKSTLRDGDRDKCQTRKDLGDRTFVADRFALVVEYAMGPNGLARQCT